METFVPVTINSLFHYRQLAWNPANHLRLINNPELLFFLETSLASDEEEVLVASVDIIEYLGKEIGNRPALNGTNVIVKALYSLADRPGVNYDLRKRARNVAELVQSTEIDHSKTTNQPKTLVILQIYGLNDVSNVKLKETLSKTKGVHAANTDIQHLRCIITAYDEFNAKEFAETLFKETNMVAKLVSRNQQYQEILVPLIEESSLPDPEELPPYLEDNEPFEKEEAVSTIKEIRRVASEWFSVAAGIFQSPYYW